jgi:hypothetical protein
MLPTQGNSHILSQIVDLASIFRPFYKKIVTVGSCPSRSTVRISCPAALFAKKPATFLCVIDKIRDFLSLSGWYNKALTNISTKGRENIHGR